VRRWERYAQHYYFGMYGVQTEKLHDDDEQADNARSV